MPQRSRFSSKVLVLVVLLVLVAGSLAYLGWRQSVPDVRVHGDMPRFVGHRTPVSLVVEAARGNVARAEVRVVQGGGPSVVATSSVERQPRATLTATIESATVGLKEGDATLEVWARDDFWRPWPRGDRAVARFPITVDLTPPKLEILGATAYLAPGGSGLVALRVDGTPRIEARAGDAVFPAAAYGPAERGARVALIAVPHDFPPGAPLTVTAQDEAGNAMTRAIPGELLPRRFPRDRIEIKDSFLQAKVPELLPQRSPSAPLLEGFLTINRDQRRQAEEEKRRIGATSADTPLWEGVFVQPRNTKVFANFAERRSYVYNGAEVDSQVHLGYDLASTKQSPVPAANKGAVVFTGPLTIYGNTVIVDHGLGLQTLYAHLSSIAVKPGDTVDKGQELGRTGTTGLAGGDHLHFEVLIRGVSVTPLEWWDGKWIRDRIARPLAQAGLPPLGGVTAAAGEDGVAAAPSSARGRPRAAR